MGTFDTRLNINIVFEEATQKEKRHQYTINLDLQRLHIDYI